MRVTDFGKYPIGLLVKRSDHYFREKCINSKSFERKAIGIVTELSFFENKGTKESVCYPHIHWENANCSEICHPSNAVPYRDKIPMTVEISE